MLDVVGHRVGDVLGAAEQVREGVPTLVQGDGAVGLRREATARQLRVEVEFARAHHVHLLMIQSRERAHPLIAVPFSKLQRGDAL